MQQPVSVVFIAPQNPIISVLRDAVIADPSLIMRSAYVYYGQVPHEKSVLDADIAILALTEPSDEGVSLLEAFVRQEMPTVVVCNIEYKKKLPRADYITYVFPPLQTDAMSVQAWCNVLIQKAKALCEEPMQPLEIPNLALLSRFKGVIAIGGSTGSTEVVYKILTSLPGNMPPIAVVIHMPPVFTNMYAQRLNNACQMRVQEALPQQPMEQNNVYIAPGDAHMRVIRQGEGFAIKCAMDEKVNGHRPSVDVLFDSVATAAGGASVGVILTGMGADGAKGLLKMRQRGAYTIGQDEASCVVYGMPCVAYEIGGVVKQAPTEQIPQIMLHYLRNY